MTARVGSGQDEQPTREFRSTIKQPSGSRGSRCPFRGFGEASRGPGRGLAAVL